MFLLSPSLSSVRSGFSQDMTAAMISVVVLGYRAEKLLIPLVARLDKSLALLRLPYEIVIVANFWPDQKDQTPRVALQIAKSNPRARVIAKPKEGDMGWDMRQGLKAVRGAIIAVLDGDTQNPVEDAASAIALLSKDTHIDLVKARRVKRYDGHFRIIQSKIYNMFFRLLFQSNPLSDINAKPKAFRRQTLQKLELTANDWFIDAEIMLEALKNGFKVQEFETVFYKNPYRHSFVNVKTILEFIFNMLHYRLTRWK